MKALVTGAAGFVGSTLSGRLLADGWSVVGVDALTPYYDPALKLENLDGLTGDFTLHKARLQDLDLEELLADVDVVFHQAGQPGVRASWGQEFSVYTEHNIEATQQLLEAARSAPRLRRLVYASSSSVYGDAQRYPTVETDRPAPVSPYGVTKLAGEHLCSLYAVNFGVPTVSLRYFTVYGPRQRPDMAFTRFLTAARTGGSLRLYGTGEQIRDFTFVEDVVSANVLAATQDVPAGTVLNIAGGTNVSVLAVFDIIREVSGRPLAIDRFPKSDGDVFRTGGDATRARELLGWVPQVGIEEGLRRQWEWVEARRA
ncbi:NAD-dependent epimerase/dehydratase family protein [Cellulomonas marina]|uniref:Nucleoside-diphosphate-sugar epimerase n=1 Tax=Cellulomonas marina TaxID=988821 RepID=A0A1I0X644_9CELL|nr:NAD-dependent epimerase/dehydratase family protein [Cellulomonas marina]GIG28920.1 putative UDP-glucose epimerase YtcB [Cellulomonas marina]SFA95503.1 Nucleoside-diphosphate-sugar epimerase [Cellulomonas marina]